MTPYAASSRTLLLYSLLASLSAAAASLLARLLAGLYPLPELALGRIVQLIPVSLFELGIRTLGGWAKPALFAGLLLLEVAALTFAGYVWLRRDWKLPLAALIVLVCLLYGLAVGILMPLLQLGFLGTRAPGGPVPASLGPLVTYALWGVGLYAARQLLLSAGRRPDGGRRRIVLAGGSWTALVLLGLAGDAWMLLHRLTITSLGIGSNRTPAITPIQDFYVVSKNVLDPKVNADEWRLVVDGSVDRPLTLTLEELRALPAAEQLGTMECISNPVGGKLISTASWKGVRLSELLSRAGPRQGTQDVVTTCADGYSESLDLASARSPDVLLVYEMNGEPLSQKHGAPVRLQVPGRYGLKSSKWVERIRLVDDDYKGYWQQESNWTDIGEVHTECRIDYPPDGVVAREGTLLTGVAYTGLRGVSRVEVSTDGGSAWSEARLEPPLGRLTWRLWSYPWRPSAPGSYTVMARAYDAEGNPQEEGAAAPLGLRPPGAVEVVHGAVGIHKLELNVAEV